MMTRAHITQQAQGAEVSLLYQNALNTVREDSEINVYHAQAHPLLRSLQDTAASLQCEQVQKHEVNALHGLGVEVSGELQGHVDLALVLPHKNKQQTYYDMARAMQSLKSGGRLMMACANAHGAKSYQQALARLAGEVQASSKSKCRIFSAKKTEVRDEGLMQQWLADGRVQYVKGLQLYSQVGLFSWNRLDVGSALLLQHIPKLSGQGMDLCCGYGALSVAVLQASPEIAATYLVDVDAQALHCADKNTQRFPVPRTLLWRDARHEALPQEMDWVVCNPPFHTGQIQDVSLGQAIIKRACQSLRRDGELWLVANRKLPYEQVLHAHLKRCDTIVEAQGFKIIHGVR